MKIAKAFVIVFVVAVAFASCVVAQRRSGGVNKDVRISKKHPTVYISFERLGKREPRHTGESEEGVWLRLHNNTQRNLSLRAYGASDRVFSKGDDEEAGMFYKVQAVPRFQEIINFPPKLPPVELPSVTNKQLASVPVEVSKVEEHEDCEVSIGESCHVCSVILSPPGKSLLFSVPREHLCKNLMLYINYQYAFELEEGSSFERSGEPQHNVYFYGSAISDNNR